MKNSKTVSKKEGFQLFRYLGGRKCGIVLVSMFQATLVILTTNKLNGIQYAGILTALAIAYVTGNAVTKIKGGE